MKSRMEALKELLQPLQWDWSTGIDYRTQYVRDRIQDVRIILPFLNVVEEGLAQKWLEEARDTHSQLCD